MWKTRLAGRATERVPSSTRLVRAQCSLCLRWAGPPRHLEIACQKEPNTPWCDSLYNTRMVYFRG